MQGVGTGSSVDPEEIFQALGQAVIATDLDGVVTHWNPAAEELYGWTSAEAVGQRIEELTVPNVSREAAADIMAALRDGVPWTGGFPVRRKDGTAFPALVTDTGVYRGGELVGIVGISTNLGQALRPLLERSTDAALVLRSDGVVSYASPAVEELFGWEEGELVGQSIVPLLHPDDRVALAEFLAQVVANPGAHPPLEMRVLCDQGWEWAEAALTNMLDDPIVRGVVCNLRRSPRRAAQEEAEIRAQQLQTALKSRLIIEQAKGFLAGRHGITPEEAFDRLRRYARSNHLSIREVSHRILDEGLLLPTG